MNLQDLVLEPAGVWSDPSSHRAPPGALATGRNVVLRRDGLLEPRPGFDVQQTIVASPPRSVHPFDGDVLCVTSSTIANWLSSGTAVGPVGQDPPRASRRRAVEARRNLYLTSLDGLVKVTSSSLTGLAAFVAAGLPEPYTPAIESYQNVTAFNWLASGDQVAYRVVYRRTDANNVVVRSAPSERTIASQSTGGARHPRLRVTLSTSIVAGDVVEVYRSDTRYTSDDTMLFAISAEVTAADVSAGYVDIDDTTAAGARGAELYTLVDGARNDVIPGCHDLALWKGYLFGARLYYQQQAFLRVALSRYVSGGASGWQSDGTWNGTTNFTTGSKTIASVDEAEVDAALSGSPYVPTQTVVSANVGGTVTMSNNAAATGTGQNYTIHPRIQVGAVNFYFGPTSEHGWPNEIVVDAGEVTLYGNDIAIARAIARAVNDEGTYEAITVQDDPSGPLVVIQSQKVGAVAFAVAGTNDYLYVDGHIDQTSDDGQLENGFAWSKVDQPEHWPRTQVARVGSERNSILRLIPTRDVLFVFTVEGVWALSGAAGQWQLDLIDATLSLLTPECAVALQDRCFAWTTRGVVGVSTGGVAALSEPAIGATLAPMQQLVSIETNRASPNGIALVASELDRELYLLLPSSTSATGAAAVWVFNLDTAAWLEWTFEGLPRVMVFDPDQGGMLVGWEASGDGVYALERREQGVSVAADRDASVTLSAVDGFFATVTGATWTLAAGDAIRQSSTDYVIVGVDGSTVEVDREGLADGAATAYQAFASTVEFRARSQRDPATDKFWAETTWLFESTAGVIDMTVEWRGDTPTAPSGAAETLAYDAGGTPAAVRFWTPQEHARSAQLYPKITLRVARARWELAGVSARYRPVSSRVWR